MKRYVYCILGMIFLGLAILGIPLPVLPTTPFLILTCLCFLKGSAKLSAWFQGTKLYKKYAAEYIETRALSVKQKCGILTCSNGMMLVSFFLVPHIALKLLLAALIIIHSYVLIFRVKTIRKNNAPQSVPKGTAAKENASI